MKVHRHALGFCLLAVFVLFWPLRSSAQNDPASLRGQVTDPSKAVVPATTVLLATPSGASIDTQSNKDGFYEFKNLAPGTYVIKAVAPGFALFTQGGVTLKSGENLKLDISLSIEVQEEKVHVSDSTTQVDVNPTSNAGAIVLRQKDLDALSDDPDELSSELQALAGPSAGPNGGQIYIDGFTGGQLPPKSSIREIRLNQNPFSSEYDKLGYGRIEIFTKPGTDKFHGEAFLTGNTAAFNSRNPFEVVPDGTTPPGYYSTMFHASVGGPMSHSSSFFFNLERRDIQNLDIVSAQVLDPTTLEVAPFSQTLSNPTTRTNLGPRVDFQLAPNNTLTARYQYFHDTRNNEGVGQFDLASQAYNSSETEHTLQLSDTQVIGAKVINETRFQFIRDDSVQNALNFSLPTIDVQGAFVDGSNSDGSINDQLSRYEIQNMTSMSLGKHLVKFGARVRVNQDDNFANSNFNGTFIFGTRSNPDPSTCPAGVAAPCPILRGIDTYQILLAGLAANPALSFQQISQMGGGASQYAVTVGTGHASVRYVDAGPYVQDDWRLRSNITLSYGLRFETQNDLGHHADFAPRLGFAWGLDAKGSKPPKTVLRAGFGIFYDRFTYEDVLQQQRLNGTVQQQFVVQNPQFYLGSIPSLSQLQNLATSNTTLYQPNPNLRTPYTLQTGVTLERQLSKAANIAFTYLNSRGVHQFFVENINSPECAALPCAATDPRPIAGNPNNLYQYQSEGIFKQSQFIINSSIRLGTRLSLFGYYTLNYAKSDIGGGANLITTFPTYNNDISLDYGRSPFDIRHRVFMGGTWGLPRGFRLSPFLIASSGNPYTITIGQDVNGDSIFNDRPSFATPQSNPANVITNKFGSFDLIPQPGEAIVPVNSLTGPARFSLNLRLSKTFGFGKREEVNRGPGGPAQGPAFGGARGGPGGGGGGRGGGGYRGGFGFDNSGYCYSLSFAVGARNLFNYVNVSQPIGNLSSPLFGLSNGLAGGPYSSSSANRRIDLQLTFS
ncbi:MAG TPA: carboxypeptidase regulatory-like domain-containing protein, partial [Candidatus Acidoferrales bacterium]|nr:carboxypeptidase regulatory-like domain-containing protein [Candidatus Acidoferrales bacterium]